MVLGCKDQIIKATDNLVFAAENPLPHINCTIYLRKDMVHRILLSEFEEEISKFFASL